MAERNYWINIFSATAWAEFLDNGAHVTGFAKRRWKTVKNIMPGDLLLCYLKEPSVFTGALEVVSEAYQDDEQIFSGEFLPYKVKVRIAARLEQDSAIEIYKLRDRLSIFHDPSNPNAWSDYFRNSPTLLDRYDGPAVFKSILEAGRTTTGEIKTYGVDGRGVTIPGEDEHDEISVEAARVEITSLLLRAGAADGATLWTAPHFRGRETDRGRISDSPGLLAELPESLDGAYGKTVERLDAVWFKDDRITAAFMTAVEKSILPSLLRLADVFELRGSESFALYIAAPESLKSKIVKEANRPTLKNRARELGAEIKFISFDGIRNLLIEETDGEITMLENLERICLSCEIGDVQEAK